MKNLNNNWVQITLEEAVAEVEKLNLEYQIKEYENDIKETKKEIEDLEKLIEDGYKGNISIQELLDFRKDHIKTVEMFIETDKFLLYLNRKENVYVKNNY